MYLCVKPSTLMATLNSWNDDKIVLLFRKENTKFCLLSWYDLVSNELLAIVGQKLYFIKGLKIITAKKLLGEG